MPVSLTEQHVKCYLYITVHIYFRKLEPKHLGEGETHQFANNQNENYQLTVNCPYKKRKISLYSATVLECRLINLTFKRSDGTEMANSKFQM